MCILFSSPPRIALKLPLVTKEPELPITIESGLASNKLAIPAITVALLELVILDDNAENGQNYISSTTSYSFDGRNSLTFRRRENKKLDLTEYYNLIYEYKNDCLIAGIEYNKQFYSDADLKPEEKLFFSITIVPFGTTTSPNINK